MLSRYRLSLICICITITCPIAYNQTDAHFRDQARKAIPEFIECLGIANDAHYPEDIEKNITWALKAFSRRDFKLSRLPTDGLDLLLAEKKIKDSYPTLLVYLQVDGQPVDASKWQQPSPWNATLKEYQAGVWNIIPWSTIEQTWNPDWRIFARSTSDAKGPILAFLAAYDMLIESNKTTDYNIKVIMDFEEELGSPNITAAIDRHKVRLKADAMMIFDGPQHLSNQPTLAFGARGIISFNLTAWGPTVNMHSGHYGNYIPNPGFLLSQLLASMKDEKGKVLIRGWYDGIKLDKKIKKILAETPDDLPRLLQSVGIKYADQVGHDLQEAIQYPSLNIDGIRSAYVGAQARTIIPDLATASMDIRLVKETSGERMVQLLKKHIIKKGFTLLDHEPSQDERKKYDKIISMNYQISYEAFRTEFDTPIGKFLIQALTNGFGKPPILIRTHGGSIPISPFVTKMNIPAVAVPTVNYDNNQHSENENIRLGHFTDAIKTIYHILITPYANYQDR